MCVLVVCAVEADESRGWCIFETRVSGLVKHYLCMLDMSSIVGKASVRSWADICRVGKAGRLPPLAPPDFAALLTDGVGSGAVGFTAGADLQIVIDAYSAGFKQTMASATALVYKGLGWGDEEASVCAQALLYAHAHGVLDRVLFVNLSNNQIGDAGFVEVANVLKETGKRFERLNATGNTLLGETGKQALEDACQATGTDLMLIMREVKDR